MPEEVRAELGFKPPAVTINGEEHPLDLSRVLEALLTQLARLRVVEPREFRIRAERALESGGIQRGWLYANGGTTISSTVGFYPEEDEGNWKPLVFGDACAAAAFVNYAWKLLKAQGIEGLQVAEHKAEGD